MSALPFSVSLILNLPADEGQDPAPIQYTYSGTVGSVVRYKLDLTDSGSQTIDFGTVPVVGAKVLLVAVDAGQGVAPVTTKVNGETVGEEVAAGGAKFLCSPQPVAGITSLAIDYTTSCTVRVWVLG
jgi:hypothetical protein